MTIPGTHRAGVPVSAAPDLRFAVQGADVDSHAAAPTLAFLVDIQTPDRREIRSITLSAQIRIAPIGRPYRPEEEERLFELFGPRSRWGETMRGFLWTHAVVAVPPFTARAAVRLPVACTYDFEVVSAKYFHAVENGEIALEFLFSGTVFYVDEDGGLRAAQVPWDKETTFRLPVALWKRMMDAYFPNSAWLRLRRDVFDRLYRYRARHSLLTWEAALDRLLAAAGEAVPGEAAARFDEAAPDA
jgi:hypothetical protein